MKTKFCHIVNRSVLTRLNNQEIIEWRYATASCTTTFDIVDEELFPSTDDESEEYIEDEEDELSDKDSDDDSYGSEDRRF